MENRRLDIVQVNLVKGKLSREYAKDFDDKPIYRLAQGNILVNNPGIRRNKYAVLLYDVTDSSPDFKRKYADIVEQAAIEKVEDKTRVIGRIVRLLRLDGVYSTLSREEMDVLGYDFVDLVRTGDETLNIEPVDTRQIRDEAYLRISPFIENEVLENKISADTTELVEVQQHEFRLMSELAKEKNFQ